MAAVAVIQGRGARVPSSSDWFSSLAGICHRLSSNRRQFAQVETEHERRKRNKKKKGRRRRIRNEEEHEDKGERDHRKEGEKRSRKGRGGAQAGMADHPF